MNDDKDDDKYNIIEFPGVTYGFIDPDKILKAAVGQLHTVLVLGITKDGEEQYIASSHGDIANLNLMLDMAKAHMLDQVLS